MKKTESKDAWWTRPRVASGVLSMSVVGAAVVPGLGGVLPPDAPSPLSTVGEPPVLPKSPFGEFDSTRGWLGLPKE
jgi:hypothetical protein